MIFRNEQNLTGRFYNTQLFLIAFSLLGLATAYLFLRVLSPGPGTPFTPWGVPPSDGTPYVRKLQVCIPLVPVKAVYTVIIIIKYIYIYTYIHIIISPLFHDSSISLFKHEVNMR